MRAIVQDHYGSPDLLRLQEIGVPVAGEHEVLVRVRAAGLHPDVWHTVHGVPFALRLMSSGLRRPKQRVPGTDLAGVVESVGPGATRFVQGDEVFGETLRANLWRNGGTYAEFATVHEDLLESKPARLSFEEAAAVPNAAKIAVQGIRDEGRVRAGQRVPINGAGGGVGTAGVQLAVAWGAEVTGVDAKDKLDLVRELGATEAIDCMSEDFTTSGERYDLDPGRRGNPSVLGAPTCAHARGHVRPDRARPLRSVRSPMDREPRTLPYPARSFAVRPAAVRLRGAKDPGDRLAVVKELIDAGRFAPVVDRSFPLAEVPAAIRYLETGAARGRIVITIDG